MDNEATKVLNEQQKETQSNVKDEKKAFDPSLIDNCTSKNVVIE